MHINRHVVSSIWGPMLWLECECDWALVVYLSCVRSVQRQPSSVFGPSLPGLYLLGEREAAGYTQKQAQLLTSSIAELHFLSWSIRDCIRSESWLDVGWRRHPLPSVSLRVWDSRLERWVAVIVYSPEGWVLSALFPVCLSSLWQIPIYLDVKASAYIRAIRTTTGSLIKFMWQVEEGRREKEKKRRKEYGEQSHVVEPGVRQTRSRTLFTSFENCEFFMPLSLGFAVCGMGSILSNGADVRIPWWSGCTVPGPRLLQMLWGRRRNSNLLQCLRCYWLCKPPRSLLSSHPLMGHRVCLLSHQNVGSIVWELGTKALPTEQGESRSEGYSQLPGHLGQIKHVPWA